MGHSIKPTVCQGCSIPKGWGSELIIENNEMYYNEIGRIGKEIVDRGFLDAYKLKMLLQKHGVIE